MGGPKRTAATVVALNSPTDRLDGRSVARPSSRERRYEQQTRTTRLAIVLSLFLAFLASALLIGGRNFIDPLLQATAQAQAVNRAGSIVVTMPGGTLCRHLSFDNKTAELSDSGVGRCSQTALQSSEPGRAMNGFAWGGR
jgi:hypothetical protein